MQVQMLKVSQVFSISPEGGPWWGQIKGGDFRTSVEGLQVHNMGNRT